MNGVQLTEVNTIQNPFYSIIEVAKLFSTSSQTFKRKLNVAQKLHTITTIPCSGEEMKVLKRANVIKNKASNAIVLSGPHLVLFFKLEKKDDIAMLLEARLQDPNGASFLPPKWMDADSPTKTYAQAVTGVVISPSKLPAPPMGLGSTGGDVDPKKRGFSNSNEGVGGTSTQVSEDVATAGIYLIFSCNDNNQV